MNLVLAQSFWSAPNGSGKLWGFIIGTIIIYRQIQHTKDRSVGFDINRLVMTEMSDDLNNHFTALRNDVMQSGLVENITTASSPVTDIYAHTAIQNWPGKTGADENIGIGTPNSSDTPA